MLPVKGDFGLPNPLTVFRMFVMLPLVWPISALAENWIGIYFGKAFTFPGEVVVRQPGEPAFGVGPVHWKDRSFDAPLYYGLRIGYRESRDSNTDWVLDFTHAKMYARMDRTVTVTDEQRPGEPESRALNTIFSNLSYSHGYNFLTANAIYRVDTDSDNARPYFGGGVGFAVPHAEISIGANTVDEYQFGGFVVQGLAGVESEAVDIVPLFVEYKLSYGPLHSKLPDGTVVELSPVMRHVIGGVRSD